MTELQRENQKLRSLIRDLELKLEMKEELIRAIQLALRQVVLAVGLDVPEPREIRVYEKGRRKITREEELRMKELYGLGHSMREIAGVVGLAEQTVVIRLIKMGVHLPARGVSAEELAEMVDMHVRLKMSARKIADQKHRSVGTVAKHLKAAGIFMPRKN